MRRPSKRQIIPHLKSLPVFSCPEFKGDERSYSAKTELNLTSYYFPLLALSQDESLALITYDLLHTSNVLFRLHSNFFEYNIQI